jgi:putative peptidoglycan lipid II flippase
MKPESDQAAKEPDRRIVGAHLVEPGSVLADRYVIEDLLAEEGDSDSWRARDKILARSVVLQILPSTSPYASDLLAAAKRASRVVDPRILQVLDAVDDGELTYVVREWATGQSLDVILSEGPLPARRATWLMREVAAAMSNAHRSGLPHRRLAPDTVVVTKSSGIKLIGLGTFAALRAEDDDVHDSPEQEDTADVGRLLYACLTARWPGGANAGLPAAPTEHGRLLRPRQVRAGVPRNLDVVCDRVLGDPPRYGDPITTVEEIHDNLTRILSEDGFTAGSVGLAAPANPASPVVVEPPPALLPRDDGGPVTGEQPTYASSPPRERSALRRAMMAVIVAVLVIGAALLAYLVGQHGNDSGSTAAGTTTTGTTGVPLKPIAIESGQSFDPLPLGSGDENPDLVPLAFDGDTGTAWETRSYFTPLEGQKPGVGLILDLGRVQDVAKVDVRLDSVPSDIELRAAPASDTTAPTASADDYNLVQSLTGAGPTASFSPDKPVRTRFLLVWLTKLPQDSTGSYRGLISEIKAYG